MQLLADGAVLYPGSYLGKNSKLGKNTVLFANVVLERDCIIGDDCIIHAGVVVGADGFGFAPGDGKIVKIPQVGIARVGDNVELGSADNNRSRSYGREQLLVMDVRSIQKFILLTM